jgi:hypothetical protein
MRTDASSVHDARAKLSSAASADASSPPSPAVGAPAPAPAPTPAPAPASAAGFCATFPPRAASPLMMRSMWSMSGSCHEFLALIFCGRGGAGERERACRTTRAAASARARFPSTS